MELALADMTGCLYCVKLVRGAYMEQEREKATKGSYEDPIWLDKQTTDTCYNHLMDLLMTEKAKRPASAPIYLMIATHNEDTIRMATERCVLNGSMIVLVEGVSQPMYVRRH